MVLGLTLKKGRGNIARKEIKKILDMNYTIEAPFNLSDVQKETIEGKLGKLTTYNSDITKIDVYFKESDSNVPGEVVSEIRVFLPGPDLFTQNKSDNLLKSFSGAYDSIKRQAKERKDKWRDKKSHR